MSGTVADRVSLKRLLFIVVLALGASAVFVPGAAAGNLDEEKMGCTGEAPATCPTGTVGQPYSLTLYVVPPNDGRGEDFGCATFRFNGSYPPGLTISDEGYITGTPTEAGIFDFFLEVRLNKEAFCAETCGSKCLSDDRFIIRINPGVPPVPKLTIGPEQSGVPQGTTGTPYSLQMTANLPDAKMWSVSGSLPPGLAINQTTGLISGTPTTAGSYSFTVQATIDAQRTDTKSLTIVVRAPLAITAGSRPFENGTRTARTEVGLPFSANFAASGGVAPYTWTQNGTLPEGIEFDATDGSLIGAAEVAGTYRFTVTVTDSEARRVTYAGTIAVAERLAIVSKRMKRGRVGRLYRSQLASTGGVAPVTWRIKQGPLPRGIRFDRSTGSFAGIPTKAGIWVVTVESIDSLRVKATSNVVFVIARALKKPTR
jgi:Putative Ig domain